MRAQGLSQDVVKDTRRFWHERAGCPVSEEDAREVRRNVSAPFELLAEWDGDSQPPSMPQEDEEHY